MKSRQWGPVPVFFFKTVNQNCDKHFHTVQDSNPRPESSTQREEVVVPEDPLAPESHYHSLLTPARPLLPLWYSCEALSPIRREWAKKQPAMESILKSPSSDEALNNAGFAGSSASSGKLNFSR